ncbi:MAG: shikimate dehydrogenase [Deltaproteobacteria bacterium]|nr:shikimate dehydrogenase [Deltaproteobacteria bacterium]RLB67862.1 MAG: shikimate dehydrogenase [Deltaproteobacteria bacterium]
MQLNGKTEVIGIFGDPVEHSLSPRMQNAAIEASGLNAVYVPFHVTAMQLCDAVSGIRAMALRGVNLTIPHKEAACHLVDELDEQAALIGAINTIVNENGHLKGYNTDGVGLLDALKQGLGVDVSGMRVLLVGAGGACRAALVSLCQRQAAWIGVANRTRERSQSLIEEMATHFSGTAFAEYELAPSLSAECSEPVDLLINTSAVGLKGDAFGFCITDCVKAGGAVFDMVYAPETTPLLHEARERGLSAVDGLGMLVAQGEAAFQLWFGSAPESHIMRRVLEI